MYIITVLFSIRQNFSEAFSSLVTAQASTSLNKEDGCLVFDVSLGKSENGMSSFFLYEVYTSEESFKKHLMTKHFIDFNEISLPMVVSKKVDAWEKIELN
ncbi:putative quinol monooxygenase [Marinomonas sp. TI.3.20]|uniref:putative quinol monooxygenase n=1 Tax=Marinomonas sp. TI.3.20 TaxID=3121296 RepID=UPI00311E0118